MNTATVDANAMNQFISSLSKSLQALCHGCVDFAKGIEMIGYININIDSENRVDCVLNEKVRKISNSLTFTSNSFMAQKEKTKDTRDASCSPIPEPTSSSLFEKPSHGVRKRSNDRDNASPFRKRRQRGQIANDNEGSTTQEGIQGTPTGPQDNFEQASDIMLFSSNDIKQEANLSTAVSSEESVDYSKSDDLNVQTIKEEANEESLYTSTPESKVEYEGHSTGNQTLSINLSPHHSMASENAHEHSPVHIFDSSKGTSTQQPSFFSQGEEEADEEPRDTNLFEVIEIGDDEEEELQGSFTQSDDPNTFGGSSEREYHQHIPSRLPSFHASDIVDTGQSWQSDSARRDDGNVSRSFGQFQCSLCPASLFSRQALYQHFKQDHQSELPFSCSICGKSFYSRSGLKHHVLAHSGRNFHCHVCDQRFYQKSHMTGHLRGVHNLKMCLTCSHYIKVEDFNKHILSYYSHNCGGSSETERQDHRNVSYNQSSSHSSRNKPNDSSKFFRSNSDTHHHKALLQSSKNVASESERFDCPYCHISMEVRRSLYQHIQLHHQAQLPFSCRICGKGFLSRTGLGHHELAHSGRNFACHICDQRFKQKTHLTTHLRLIHDLKKCFSCMQLIKLDDFHQHALSCRL